MFEDSVGSKKNHIEPNNVVYNDLRFLTFESSPTLSTARVGTGSENELLGRRWLPASADVSHQEFINFPVTDPSSFRAISTSSSKKTPK